jgi:uncharacterized coiled-coil protein SlyX
MEDSQRFDQLELKVAYLEQANTELSDELFRQRQQLEALRGQISDLAGKFAAAQSQPTAYTPEDETPPHY